MNAPLRIGARVLVDEELERNFATVPNPAGFDEEYDDLPVSDSSLDANDRSEVRLYDVIGYELATDRVDLEELANHTRTRTVHRRSVVVLDSHIKDAAATALAEHRENLPAALSEDDPIPDHEHDADVEAEAQRRTEILRRHCRKENPISKKQAMEELKLRPTIFHKLKRTHLADPDWHAQLPGRDGRRAGEKRLDPRVEEIIRKVFKSHRTGYGANDAEALDEIIRQCKAINARPPSRTTLWRRWTSLTLREQISAVDGPEAANAKVGHFPTPTVEEFYPGRMHDIDHTPLDCHAIDSLTRKPLGRPHLTLVWDRDIKAIAGFALFFGAPKRASISAAIYMAITPKTELLAKYGLSHLHWPIYGKPVQYVVDHGSDLMAESFQSACKYEKIHHVPRMRPQSGGGVERMLGILNKRLSQRLEGGTASAPKKGKGYKPDKKAVYTLRALTEAIIAWICKWNNRKAKKDGLSPNQRFERKYGLHDGVLISPPMVADPRHFIIDILQGHEVTVARNAVVTRELAYEIGPFKDRVGKKIMIKIDPNNIHRIWGKEGDRWVRLKLINIHDVPQSLSEHKAKLKQRRNNPEPDNRAMDAQAALNDALKRGRDESKAAQKAREDAAQTEHMGHFGDPPQGSDTDIPATTDPFPVVILQIDEEL